MTFGLFGSRFDTPEFIFGFFLGLFTLWIIRRIFPILIVAFKWSASQLATWRENLAASTAEPYFQDLLFRIDNLHLANPLFPLRQVIITPRLLIPQTAVDPFSASETTNQYSSVLPSLSDWNTLAGIYQLPSIKIEELLNTDASVLITGDLGSGKSTALAYLALKIINDQSPRADAKVKVPVLMHAIDFELPQDPETELYEAVIDASKQSASQSLSMFLPRYLRPHLREGKTVLLIDGLDEVPQSRLEPISEWMRAFLEHYPQHQIIASGPPRGYDGLIKAGLIPMAISPWNKNDLNAFLLRWANTWQRSVVETLPQSRIAEVDPFLLNAWLRVSKTAFSPLEITLRTWSAYVGDIQKQTLSQCLSAYVKRMISPNEQHAAQSLAVHWIRSGEATMSENSIDKRIPINDLVQAGILKRRSESSISFANPSVGAYLAAMGMNLNKPLPVELTDSWQPRLQCFRHFAVVSDMSPYVDQIKSQMSDPLQRALISSAAWLRETSPESPWRNHILSAIAMILQDDSLAYGLRFRALQSIIFSDEKPARTLFKKMLQSEEIESRVLGAIGLGGLLESEDIGALQDRLQNDEDEQVRFVSCIALAAIGTSEALIVLGRLLLEGDNTDQLFAAEALASHLGEGFAMLVEASKMEAVHIRRAAVYGLGHVRNEEALAHLRKIEVEDDQAIVRNAVTEVLEMRENPGRGVLVPHGEVSELPWLLEFASELGLGVTPGKGAFEMLRRAMVTGTLSQQKAALLALGIHGSQEFVLDVISALDSENSGVQNVAFEALWRLEAAGAEVMISEIKETASEQ
jgi:HEAT repeat protein